MRDYFNRRNAEVCDCCVGRSGFSRELLAMLCACFAAKAAPTNFVGIQKAGIKLRRSRHQLNPLILSLSKDYGELVEPFAHAGLLIDIFNDRLPGRVVLDQ